MPDISHSFSRTETAKNYACSSHAAAILSSQFETFSWVPSGMDSVWCYREVQYHFLSPGKEHIEKFVCPVCLSIVHIPVQTSCGHLFCLKCFEGIKSKAAEAADSRTDRLPPVPKCPTCMGTIQGEPVRDKFNEREVRNFRVKCPYSENGCTWDGYLPEVEKHLRTDVVSGCQFQLLPCKRCSVKVERRHLSKRLKKDCEMRESRCPHGLLSSIALYASMSLKIVPMAVGLRASLRRTCHFILLHVPFSWYPVGLKAWDAPQ